MSFEVKHGEVLGLIGRNGAGKSTLLKILSRITDPSGGEAQVFGRVGSLLEVGAGSPGDPDPSTELRTRLTGRENIRFASTARRLAWAHSTCVLRRCAPP